MVKLFYIFLFFLTMIFAGGTKIENGLEKCFDIQNDSSRLICYDMLTSSLINKNEKLQSIGKWDVKLQTNSQSGNNVVILNLNADIGHGKWNKPVTLEIRCENNKKLLSINWKNFVQNSSIILKIDNKLYNKKRWRISNNGKITHYSGKSAVLIRKLLNASKLSVKTNIIDSNPITAIFDIAGFRVVYESVKNLCSNME